MKVLLVKFCLLGLYRNSGFNTISLNELAKRASTGISVLMCGSFHYVSNKVFKHRL